MVPQGKVSGNNVGILETEAITFGRYLIKQTPSSRDLVLYKRALTKTTQKLTHGDQAIVDFAIRHPWCIGLLDGYCAMFRPQAELRRRLYTLLAILETNPAHHPYFLPKNRSVLYLIALVGIGLRACYRVVGGAIVIQFIRTEA